MDRIELIATLAVQLQAAGANHNLLGLCIQADRFIDAAEQLVGRRVAERHPARPDQCEACGDADDCDYAA